jgi:ATP adenylyltransferase
VTDGYFFTFDKLNYIRSKRNGECILCKIVRQEPDVDNLTVFSDELFTVSLNLFPYNPGHLLIFPREHIEDVRAFDEAADKRLSTLVRYFLTVLESVHRPEGFNIGYNMGRAAGASISHLHLHIIPRYPSEIGMADLIAGKRVLVEDPRTTLEKIKAAMLQRPFSISMT